MGWSLFSRARVFMRSCSWPDVIFSRNQLTGEGEDAEWFCAASGGAGEVEDAEGTAEEDAGVGFARDEAGGAG